MTSTVLICASLMALTACGGEDTADTAGSSPSTSAAPSSAAPSASAAPSSSAAAGATGGMSDKKLCESAKKASMEMKDALIAAMRSGGDLSPDAYKKVLTDLDAKMTTLAASGGDSKVATALKLFGAEATKAAAAADPAAAADNPAFLKAGTDLTAACKAAGVTATF